MAAGINHITKNYELPKNVILTKANDSMMHQGDIADFVLALTISYIRSLPAYVQQKEQAIWQAHLY